MSKAKKLLGAAALSVGLIAGHAAAHPMWMLPSEFNLSTDEGHWITVDATASHGVFSFDKPLGVDNVAIYRPGGERERVGPYFKGQRRSVFDVQLNEQGTYKVELVTPVRYMTSYVVGGRDTARRIMGNKLEIASQLPEDARDVRTTMVQNIIQFYVTQKAPTRIVLEPTGQGFELNAITHPSDIVIGEEASFKFTFNGEPVADLDVEVVPGGTAWRSSRMQMDLKTDSEGVLRFTPEKTGPHLLSTNMRRSIDSPLADQAGVTYMLSFEVIPE
ncbi:DUF4198 domain-containing protein [Nitrincola tibetensis]|uniref:DUF4198 domain-containing protein n=1 Tax=Nitrincola tibetensis TaxID=2219697 RepID=A0A364NK73_9GAMM|nr:DUF4198 domain-containing protein [Nitrincola tibetensis]RAU17529.1 DUF4198 domain-containing protein [Nitrincola tibetensis]